jgi:hypothetical protein
VHLHSVQRAEGAPPAQRGKEGVFIPTHHQVGVTCEAKATPRRQGLSGLEAALVLPGARGQHIAARALRGQLVPRVWLAKPAALLLGQQLSACRPPVRCAVFCILALPCLLSL